MKLELDILKSLINNGYTDRDKRNVYGECPNCGHSEFGISTGDNHLFGCFRLSKCGFKGNIYTLLRKIERLDLLEEEVIRLDEELNIELKEDRKQTEEIFAFELPKIDPPLGFRRIFENKYLDSRGFKGYDRHKVGITKIEPKFKDRVIFLIEEEGEIRAFLGRGVNDSIKPKYRNSSSDFSKLLYGLEEINEDTNTVILVEGLLDKDNTDEQLKLYQQDEIKCCCTFGAKISTIQILKLKICGVKRIILLYENDVIDKIQNYAFILNREFEKVEIALPPENKDPGNMKLSEFQLSLKNTYNSVEFFRKKMKIINLN